jgi:acyl transferase domain-containing protein/acyl carrier protein/cyclopropane fatty-acyl-phospholipid synthase-like methyltransferase
MNSQPLVSPNTLKEMDRLMRNWLAALLPEVDKSCLPAPLDRWYEASVSILGEQGEGGGDMSLEAIQKQWRQGCKDWGEELRAQAALVERAMRYLPALLRGEVRAREILFPEGSMAWVAGIHQGNPMADYFNRCLCEQVGGYLKNRMAAAPASRICILEVGAGVGATTALLLEETLKSWSDAIEEYCFSDLSNAFLVDAQDRFSDRFSFFTTAIVDIDQDLILQGLEADRYDLVIAANVIHATPNIRRTLNNLKRTLHKGGLLLINELSQGTLFTHLTFGLLDAWWQHEDRERRLPGTPLLDADGWGEVLDEAGFSRKLFPAPKDHQLGQLIVVAESDGVIHLPSCHTEAEWMRQAAADSEIQVKSADLECHRSEVQEQLLTRVRRIVASTLRLAEKDIDPYTSLEHYGLDSIVAVQLAKSMREHFDKITTTLFFEAQSVHALVEYLLKTQGEALDKRFKLTTPSEVAAAEPEQALCVPASSVSKDDEPIAIIAIAGRYPGARELHQLWDNLKEGRDLITEVPAARWDAGRYYNTTSEPGKSRCQWGGFLSQVDQFDPLFFDRSPREAALLAPEERLFLEITWQLLEASAHTRRYLREHYQRQVGVFVGAMYQHYRAVESDFHHRALVSISSYSAIANHVSRFFDLCGPSVAIDTMCSASSVAIHMACESLRQGACRIAIAGGVNLSLHPEKFVGLSQAQLLGSHAQSRSFSQGDGYLPAEAVGAVLLKPFAAACAEGDDIIALIRASHINHDGHTAGVGVPNPKAQAALIKEGLRKAGIDPMSIGYVEAAANGSELGDAIEFATLTQVMAHPEKQPNTCPIGTVKSNIGHPEAASGIAQLTKVVLQLRHQQWPPTIKAEPLNPQIDLRNTPFYLLKKSQPWPAPVDERGSRLPRRASVSSFGGGGTNAYLVVEEYLGERTSAPVKITPRDHKPHIILLSARGNHALRRSASNLHHYLQAHPEVAMPSLAATLQLGRDPMEVRLAFVVDSAAALSQRLRAYLASVQEDSAYYGVCTTPCDHYTEQVSPQALQRSAAWLSDEDYPRLLRHWVDGGAVAWSQLYTHIPAPRLRAMMLALPTYPFEYERCWLSKPNPVTHQATPWRASGEHHTAHYEFDGSESFLRDHNDALPALMHLALAGQSVSFKPRAFRRVIWHRPAQRTRQRLSVDMIIQEGVRGRLGERFEAVDDQGGLYAQGEVLAEVLAPAAQALDLKAIKERCAQSVSKTACQDLLRHAIGPSLSAIEAFYYNHHEGLAQLRNEPREQIFGFDLKGLNSAVLGAVLHQQVTARRKADEDLPMPFVMVSLSLYAEIPKQAWVHVTLQPESSTNPRRYGLSVSDDKGVVRAEAQGFSATVAGDWRCAEDLCQGAKALTEKCSEADPSRVALEEVLVGMLSEIQKIEVARIQDMGGDAPWSRYGLSSLGFTQFAERLNQRFGLQLMPTLFFENTTLHTLRDYLRCNHGEKLTPSRDRQTPHPYTPTYPAPSKDTHNKLAIVGMAGRMPGSEDLHQFWDHLRNNRDLISEVPRSRWDWRSYYGDAQAEPGKTRAKWGGFIQDMACFDPRFFGLSPHDAEWMDPQSRLVLESAWAALEHAGYDPTTLAGHAIGVFVGASTADYKELCQQRSPDRAEQIKPFMIANRVSYHLDLNGPSEVVDTACSSSLVALHRAAEAIRQGSCEAALAGGVNIIASPQVTLSLSQAGVLSEDGRCMAFDSRANGMVRGEGVGMVLLKPLSQAIEARDSIYAVICASAENHDGRSSSASAPNPEAQQALIYQVLERADIDPRSIGYIEAHGTGTVLGDPVEVKGLREAFTRYYQTRQQALPAIPHCALGSVKTNIGHLEAAAGISGVFKVLAMFRQGEIPGNPHLREPNPYLELQGSPFYLAHKTHPWEAHRDERGKAMPRCAGVSSFGIGGSNAHLLLQEYPCADAHRSETSDKLPVLIPLSARNEARLRDQVANLQRYLSQYKNHTLTDLAWTLRVGRCAMPVRLGICASSLEELQKHLGALLKSDRPLGHTVLGESPDRERLRRWVNAEEVTWTLCNKDVARRPMRIGLPTYPFAREHYWINTPEQAHGEAVVNHLDNAQEGVDLLKQELLLSKPQWHSLEVEKGTPPSGLRQWVLICDRGGDNTLPALALPGERLQGVGERKVPLEARFDAMAGAAYDQLRQLLEQRPQEPVLVQIVAALDQRTWLRERWVTALSGMLNSVAQENRRILGQFIEMVVDEADPPGELVLQQRIEQCAMRPKEPVIRYLADGSCQGLRWRELPRTPTVRKQPWRSQGIYLITGGMGGLGQLFAREIATQAEQPTLILVGRSHEGIDTEAILASIKALGCQVHYRQVDVSRRDDVTALIGRIQAQWGGLHGILHCAGVNHGRYLINKSRSEWRSVLAPKVAGCINLDAATASLDLDLFVLFSSGSAVVGYPGQSDYALANAFLDRFSEYRHALVEQGSRKGRTLSVNWPLWREGGMRMAASQEQAVFQEQGVSAISTASGMHAFYQMLACPEPRMAVLAGDLARIRHTLFHEHSAATASASTKPPRHHPSSSQWASRTLDKMRELLSHQLKLAVDEIEADKALEHYGIDSLVIMQLNQVLESIFGPIPKTLLFECRTLRELSDQLAADYPEESARWCGFNSALVEGTNPEPKKDRTAMSDPENRRLSQPLQTKDQEPVAIIGVAGRYPKAPTLARFWEQLYQGFDAIREVPEDRWPLEGFYCEDPRQAVAEGKSYSKWGGFLEDFDCFDPLFFNIAPREASVMDPQERLFLQTAWAAVEDAGYCREHLRRSCGGRVGVFVGITKTGFDLLGPDLWREGKWVYPHTSFGSVANRISYLLDLNGPSMPVDTLCSSSLSALHQACEHIARGECEMAIAGGVNLYQHPSSYTSLCAYGFLAKDHRCRSFGAGGDGFVPGEGVGAVVLKPLSRAVADGDPIHALVRATSVNHDGKTNGYTVPNPNAQAQLVRSALDRAGISARAVSYVEAHGTGTQLGDPIEVRGLTQAFRKDSDACGFAALGSVKSNIGHLEAAAGIAGLTKILLQMKHGQLVPSLHAQKLNPNIDFDQTPFKVARKAQIWHRPKITVAGKEQQQPRIAALSSFGAGGANAHAIIEEYLPAVSEAVSTGPYIVVLSAADEQRLRKLTRNLLQFLQQHPQTPMDALAWTLQSGREALRVRSALLCDSLDDLCKKLQQVLRGEPCVHSYFGDSKRDQPALASLLGDEDAETMMAEWIAKAKLEKLSALWCQGLSVAWERLYPKTPRRCHLPTYPFAKERYRFPGTVTNPALWPSRTGRAKADPPLDPAQDHKAPPICFCEQWRDTEAITTAQHPPQSLYCCASDESLRAWWTRGQAQLLDNCAQAADPLQWEEQNHPFLSPDQVVHSVLFLGRGVSEDAHRIAALLRTLAAAESLPQHLVLAGRFDNGKARSHLESWIGFQRSLRLSHPDMSISVVLADARMDEAQWRQRLQDEIAAGTAQAICYQGRQRQCLTTLAVALPESVARPQGNILITGGCGGLGFLLAECLAQGGDVNLVLTGTSPLDSSKQEQIAALERYGGKATYVQADVADPEAMKTAMAAVRARFGALHGVFHAAGVAAEGSVFTNSAETFRQVIRPKVAGLLTLCQVVKDDPLRFFCCFSSSSAVLGDFGSCDYAVANRFLSAFMEYGEGLAGASRNLAVQWPLWRDGGMGQGDEAATALYLKSSAQRMLEREEGLDLLWRMLHSGPAQVLVLCGDPVALQHKMAVAEDHDQQGLALGHGSDLSERVGDILKQVAGERLQIPVTRFDDESTLADFGFDSITLAEYARSLSETLGVTIAPALFYAHPSFSALTAYFVAEHSEQMAARLDHTVPGVPTQPLPAEKTKVTARQPRWAQPLPRTQDSDEPIAIVGMAGRFPQADDLATFWRHISEAKSAIGTLPKGRTGAQLDPDRRGAYLEDIEAFDPLLFEIPPHEAAQMDPRQRLFLEVAWHAFEDAALIGERIRGSACGVFVGVEEGLSHWLGDKAALNSHQNATLAARIAYRLDLKGPNLALTSACSSALVALHQAILALRQGDCDSALVGGINLMLSSDGFSVLERAGLLSKKGVAAVFDQRADGLVPGEAVAAVVLKPLSQARREGDRIYGSILASGVNYDGKTNGITAPNPLSQAALIESLCQRLGLDPTGVRMAMAHSLGSATSDAIEVAALTQALRTFTDARQFCAITSVKPLIGHTFAASGLVSLMVALLAMRASTIPGLFHLSDLNAQIDAHNTPLIFPRHNKPWPKPSTGEVRRAWVGATGVSGTNAQLIVQEATEQCAAQAEETGPCLVPFSARTEALLRQLITRYVAVLSEDGASLTDIAWTLQRGREAQKTRLAVVAESVPALRKKLQGWLRDTAVSALYYARVAKKPPMVSPRSLEQGELCELAQKWVNGAQLPWARIQPHGQVSRWALPLSPFERRKNWRRNRGEFEASKHGVGETTSELYRTIAELERPAFKEGFLTFFPLLERPPGFSITRVALYPERYPQEVALIREKQYESRRVLFSRVDFSQVRSVLDFGCGYGNDLIDLAQRFPHINAHGYTITAEQAQAGNRRIAEQGLQERAVIFHRDSTCEPFPERYDLVLGIEVTCHIEAKQALFYNILAALKEQGQVLLIDFVAKLRGAIVDPKISVYIPTPVQWVDLFSQHHLRIDRMVDLSAQIAQAIDDPECEDNTRHLPPVLRDSWRNWTHNAVAIRRGWVGYNMFYLSRAETLDQETLRALNHKSFAAQIPYPQALRKMIDQEGRSMNQNIPQSNQAKTAPKTVTSGADKLPVLERIFCGTLHLSDQELKEIDQIAELGLSSLNAVALLERINETFDLDLPTSVIFEFGDLPALADYIAERTETASTPTAAPQPVPILEHEAGSQPLRTQMRHTPQAHAAEDVIAIVGFACRCAGADNAEALWTLVREGGDAVTQIQDPHWLAYFQRYSQKPVPSRYGAMAGIDRFDPLFFRISPKEADAMRIVQRLLLEESYKALEHAALAPSSLGDAAVGTYIGIGSGLYPEEEDHSHLAMLGVDPSIAAARIAFMLNLKGPAVAVNTACSSSLVALDLAVKALRGGDIDAALAGGITIWDHPAPFVSMNHAGMLSPSGVCRPFDAEADGIVMGDGVGMVVLKRLADAYRDHDCIHAIIRASATNQDGQTSGITVPSFLSQSRLQSTLYARAGIQVEEMQYVEAHGTATKLGDPVEIHALSDSFGQFTQRKRFCAIGSLKSNIGHTAAAAGVLSLIKVVSAMTEGKLPPCAHFQRENPHIRFDQSPFYVNTELQEWSLNQAGQRMAAVSSFGYSGTNAHLVVTSEPRPASVEQGEGPYLILLSARNEEGLRRVAEQLHAFVQKRPQIDLAALAWTLQVGRDALEQRVALEVASYDALLHGLGLFAAGEWSREASWRGGCEAQTLSMPRLDQEEVALLLKHWLDKGQHRSKLAQLWVSGHGIDWAALYDGKKPRRIPLPTYPFERRRCKVPQVKQRPSNPKPSINAGWLHPLLEQNLSDLSGVRFVSHFDGSEPFLSDHRVAGVAVLPGVACLEMVRAALQRLGIGEAGMPWLRQVAWVRPIVVAHPLEVTLHVTATEKLDGSVRFEICTYEAGESVRHVQGFASAQRADPVAPLELARHQAATSAQRMSPQQCYAIFEEAGVKYGPTHRAIDEVWLGDGQLLAHLSLPRAAKAGSEAFMLHPSLMDGALQAAVGLVTEASQEQPGDAHPMLPFALGSLQIFSPLPPTLWVWIRTEQAAETAERKLLFDLCDEQGNVCVQMLGLVARALRPGEPRLQTAPKPGHRYETLIREPVWRVAEPTEQAPLEWSRREVVLMTLSATLPAPFWQQLVCDVTTIHVFTSQQRDAMDRFCDLAQQLFSLIKALIREAVPDKRLLQVVVDQDCDEMLCALGALLKTVHQEKSDLFAQLLEIDPLEPPQGVMLKLDEAANNPRWQHIRYAQGLARELIWQSIAPTHHPIPWRDHGVYLISGGAGALGAIFARDIAHSVVQPTLVLAGRRASADPHIAALVQALEGMGATVFYKSVDITHAEAVRGWVNETLARCGRIDGILHTAGVIRDAFAINKSAEDFDAVLRPKVAGAVHLDRATADLPLDLFVLFSSVAGIWGNHGQSDYASANAFLDRFAHWRNHRSHQGQRQGLTCSINWPLWRDGGMRVDEAAVAQMWQKIGAVPLETQAGVHAFYAMVAAKGSQYALMQGDAEKLRSAGFGGIDTRDTQTRTTPAHPSSEKPRHTAPLGCLPVNGDENHAQAPATEHLVDAADSQRKAVPDPEAIRHWVVGYLTETLSGLLNLRPGELDLNRDLSAYGLDSVMVLEINNELEAVFEDLPQTLFFEYANVAALADYFVSQRCEAVARRMSVIDKASTNHHSDRARTLAVSGQSQAQSKPKRPQHSQNLSLDEMIMHYQLEIEPPALDQETPCLSDSTHQGDHEVEAQDPLAAYCHHSPFQSFAPFAQPLEGFSMAKTLVNPLACRDHLCQVAELQAEMRQVLFQREPWSQVGKVLDLGCGIGGDLAVLAKTDEALLLHGLTCSQADAKAAKKLFENRGLGKRAQVFVQDSCKYRYSEGYGVIFSIQSMHFIDDYKAKKALFRKLAHALRQDGAILLADYFGTGSEPIRDPSLGTAVHTEAQWVGLLSQAGLRIQGSIDVSQEVANFQTDPLLEEISATLPPQQAAQVSKLGRQVVSLQKGWVRFLLLRMVLCKEPAKTLEQINQEALRRNVPYAEARRFRVESFQAYNDVLAHFPEFLPKQEVSV